MKVVCLGQKKGGVGKTTLTKILAEYLALVKGLRVLLVDLDSQCSLSLMSLDMDGKTTGFTRPPVHPDYDEDDPEDIDWNGRSSSADIFFDGGAVPYEVLYPRKSEGFHILPADERRIADVDSQYMKITKRGDARTAEAFRNRLNEFCNEPEVQEAYDIVVIDTAPSSSRLLLESAMCASTHLIVPVQLEPQCRRGLKMMIGVWSQENAKRVRREPLDLIGLQVNMYKKATSLHSGILDSLRNDPAISQYLSPLLIPDRIAFAERDDENAKPRSIYDLPASSDIRQISEEFCEYVIGKLGLEVPA